ncbi:shikimate kinase [Evansella vedderi]|uniref:Shikimate kinase n=1 Tax=Evansella vedderi TaxID=38282 RepID=A0ABT9ZYH4_9BACI|nr:shikimate kinase [Evansella vedderi]MDQ0256282.1 shikimate kinase [Evansella vedderi]
MKEWENIYLVGFMGVGKTTVGKELAKAIERSFVDLDEYIIQKQQLTIPEIFERFGESGFRKMETDALKDCFGKKAVVSTGGGIVEVESNIQCMEKSGIIVFLNASFETIYDRIKGDSTRPLTNEGLSGLKNRFERRIPLYKKGKIIIDTEEKSVEEVIKEIYQHIHV